MYMYFMNFIPEQTYKSKKRKILKNCVRPSKRSQSDGYGRSSQVRKGGGNEQVRAKETQITIII